jgi:conserved oligomeric Golgi complex subunit 4
MLAGQLSTSHVDLHQLRKLSNLNDINRLLHETLTKERNIDGELEKLLAKRSVIEGSLAALHSGTAEVRFEVPH